jgi:hypothetical protein
MKAYGGVDVYIHIFLTSAVAGGEAARLQDSSASALTSLLSGEYPATELFVISTVAPPLFSLHCEARLNWTLVTHQPTTSLQSTELHSPGLGYSLYSFGANPTENIILHWNWLRNPVVLLLDECMLLALPSSGLTLQSRRLATALYTTI